MICYCLWLGSVRATWAQTDQSMERGGRGGELAGPGGGMWRIPRWLVRRIHCRDAGEGAQSEFINCYWPLSRCAAHTWPSSASIFLHATCIAARRLPFEAEPACQQSVVEFCAPTSEVRGGRGAVLGGTPAILGCSCLSRLCLDMFGVHHRVQANP